MRLSDLLGAAWLLLSLPALLTAQSPAEWQAAAKRIVRLAPAAFPELPISVRKELERRGCRIPQLGPAFGSHRSNVVSGRFARAGQRDWAVLCSRADSSQVLLFWGGRADHVDAWKPTADVGWLQSMGAGGIQYSQYVGVADSASIVALAREHDGPLPPGPITHDGLEVGFAEKASGISYWAGGRWYRLQGAD
jgi:hypothetical protein